MVAFTVLLGRGKNEQYYGQFEVWWLLRAIFCCRSNYPVNLPTVHSRFSFPESYPMHGVLATPWVSNQSTATRSKSTEWISRRSFRGWSQSSSSYR